ncbi:MAG TPA: hypothetical protein VM261_13545 [Kofleriaceae bacterium]|nr:hypothetical protein [Kofleriaceae bacterium]
MRNRSSFLAALLASLPLSLLAACDEVEQGRLGQVELTPGDCGQLFCDLDEGIATGGDLSVSLRRKDGAAAYGLTLVSSAPWIVDVISASDGGFEPRFRVLGTGAGRADLIVLDEAGYEIDYLPVEVATVADLEVSVDAENAIPLAVVGYDSAYEIKAGERTVIDVVGTSRGRELTGDFEYAAFLDPRLAAAMQSGSDLGGGHLELVVPSAGDHELTFIAPGGATERIRLIVR